MSIHFTPSTPTISDLTLHLQMAKPVAGPEQTEIRSTFFPAEWFPQSGVQLTWPHAATDWAPLLAEVDDCFIRIALEILVRNELLLIVTPEPDRIKSLFHERIPSRLLPHVRYFECPTNDTWARDHGFLTLMTESGPRLLDFQFNGWGGKFPAELDNEINRKLKPLYRPLSNSPRGGEDSVSSEGLSSGNAALPPTGGAGRGAYPPTGGAGEGLLHGDYESHLDFVFEGGSIESDGRGTLMTTSACLLSPNRNPGLTQQQIEERLLRWFHAERVLWLDHGYLAGDDTDSHIDTLARFCPGGTIAYVQCTDPADEHYEALHLMEEQLSSLTSNLSTINHKPSSLNPPLGPTGRSTLGEPSARPIGTLDPSRTLNPQPSPTGGPQGAFQLLPLPMPSPIYDPDDGHRLPATYANFLIINGAVLMPTYGQPDTDDLARRQLQKAFPKYDIVPIDCRVLIRQHGSLHCSTMQFPVGVLV